MRNQKAIKLYNVLFPIWMLFLFPVTWLIVLPGNFIIDLLVVLLTLIAIKASNKKCVLKKSILWIWMFGFVSDLIASLFMIAPMFVSGQGSFFDWFYQNVSDPLSSNPFTGIYSFTWATLCIVIAGVLIYFLNLKVSLRKTDLPLPEKRKIALSLAIFTAPYLFYLPTTWLYR